ncbi:SRPBCC domain-containing protein, partial [Mycobacterium tuberculosis]
DVAHAGHVTAYDPPHVIEHSWFENIPPAATVRWALEPDGAGCVLTLTQSFPGKDDATRNGAGWTMIMGQLDAWLDGEPFQPAESWRQVRDRLVGELGPEAVRDGRKFEVDGRPVVQFKRVVPTPVPELWAWLVEPTKLKHWLGDVDVELRPGGAYRVRFEMAPVTMDGTITEVDPPRLLALIW